MLYAFDLDGVLVNTRDANLAAYRALGVEPPADFHQRMWNTWTDEETHRKKNQILPSFMNRAGSLPLLTLARNLPHIVLSSSSARAFRLVDGIFNISSTALQVWFELSLPQKALQLRLTGEKTGIYFDDSPHAVDYIKKHVPGWQACLVK